MAVLNIGAATEVEMKEIKARVEDALHATRAAVEEGIIAGGGIALLRSQSVIDQLELDGDVSLGARIVSRAIEEPIRQISANTGFDGSVVVERVRDKDETFGFNARTEQFEDLIAAGVIDPTKVTRSALENAASVAGLLLMTDAVVFEKEEEEKMPPMPPGGGMGGMY